MNENDERPTIALAREIAGWDQDNPDTKRIPHWAVNLAAHLMDKRYARRAPVEDAEPVAYEVLNPEPGIKRTLVYDPHGFASESLTPLYRASQPAKPIEVTDAMARSAAHAMAQWKKDRTGSPAMVDVDMARAAIEAALKEMNSNG